MADLTINYQREMVVDFTMPFLDLGISVLYVKAQEKDVNLFAFLSPLSMYVWMLMILGGVSVSIVMYFIARWSPYETLELDSDEGQTPFASFHHCLWFSVASWVQQGCDFLPRYVVHDIHSVLPNTYIRLLEPFLHVQWPVFGGSSL